MPNWCNNTIDIVGPTETIKQVWEDAACTGLLEAMVPMPKDLEDTTSPSEGVNWYNWRVSNWGTKWDIDMEGLEFTDNGDGTASISGWFDSAWSPPIEAYNAFLDDMDNCYIEAYYQELGMDFVGKYEDGEETHFDDVSEIVKQPEEEWPEGFAELNEHYALLNCYEDLWEMED